MAAPTRPKATTGATPAADNRVSFGDDTFYSAGGGGIPEGRYTTYYDAVLHQYEKQDGTKVGPEFLAVRVAAYSLDNFNPDAEPLIGYYSMGSKAILSFMPNADDEGKSLLAVPGGPATGLNDSCNWNLYRKSLRDSGMPDGVFTNDLRAIDGTWVHIVHVPEPENRKTMAARTGEAQPEERANRTIAVVTEILENGSPWEGTGGFPEAAPAVAPAKVTRMPARPGATAPKASAPPAAAPARRAPGRAPAPPPPTAESPVEDDDLLAAAQTAAAAVIETSPNGVPKLVLKTGVFKAAGKTNGNETAQKILDTYWVDDNTLSGLLGTLGYKIDGPRVVPIPTP